MKPHQLMQKLDIDLEQQEKIYQSELGKNARLEIENLKNEVAKHRQHLKEKLNQSLKEEQSENDDSKLSNLSNDLDKDIMPPPLNMEARSIKRIDSGRSARLSQIEKSQSSERYDEKLDEITDNTDLTDDNSDEINLSPNPFVRSQFRRSFMNAVYTQRPPNIAASYHASHAYCGPVDDDLNSNSHNLAGAHSSSEEPSQNLEQASPKQLTMQQRRDQLQRLLHSDSSVESDLNNGKFFDLSNAQQRAIKPPRNTFKLTKDCLLNSESVRATPAVIVATPEKPAISAEEEERLNEDIHQQISQNIEQVNQVKKQLAFDLIEPVVVAHKPPRNNSRATRKRPVLSNEPELLPEIIQNEGDRLINVKDRVKLLEQNSSENSSNSSLNLPKDSRTLVIEPVNLTNRLRSCSLTLCEERNDQNRQRERHRSLSGQNMSCLNNNETLDSNVNQANNDPNKSFDNLEMDESNKLCDQQEKQTVGSPERTSNPTDKLNEDEEDNGYLTMESKLSSNNETDEQQFSLSPSMDQNVEDKNSELQNKCVEKQSIEDIIPVDINFDEVFGATQTATSPTSSNEADDEQSLKSQINQTIEPQLLNQLATEDDNRKTVDDQFAIYSGMNTIKKAPATYHNARKANDFKLTSALIEQKPNCKQSQLAHQFVQVTSAQQIITPAAQFTPEQWNALQQSSQACDPQSCSYKPQQIVASSLINRSNNLVFVSNPVINPELMDNNPCYESFDGIMYGQSCPMTKEQPNLLNENLANANNESVGQTELSQRKEMTDADNSNCRLSDCDLKEEQAEKLEGKLENKAALLPSTSTGQTNAPYYYSDLLPEEQQLEPNKTDEERPPLSSRNEALNNSRNMAVTSLQKLSATSKKLSNSERKLNEFKISDEEFKQEQTEPLTSELCEPEKVDNLNSQPEEHSNSNSILSVDELNLQQAAVSNSMSRLYESEIYNQMNDEPVYENVTRSQSSINLSIENENCQTSYSIANQEPVDDQDDYLNENVLRRASHNFIQQNAKMKPIDRLDNQGELEMDDKISVLNNNQTPTKLNNSIKNPLNHHRTTPIHLRSPTVAGYATIDSEQAVLINDDYKVQQTSDVAINTNNANSQISKLTWKPNLISHSASNLNKIKLNNLTASHPHESGSTNSLSSSSAQSLNQLPRNEFPNESGSYSQLQALTSHTYFRQQSAPNLSINNNLSANNLSDNYHGNNLNNLNNNTEKCLANKQLNLNKNINKINNLLNANGQDYVVYENADSAAERNHLLALQKQLQQQQELLIQQQRQLQMLQLLQRPALQPPLPGYSSTSSSSSLLNNSSLLNDSTIPFDHHLKNLENVPVIQKSNQNYHNYQNIFQDDQL